MLSAAVLQEPFGVGQWAGGALVIAGALFCEFADRWKIRFCRPFASAVWRRDASDLRSAAR